MVTPQLGTDGNRILYPFRGMAQGMRSLSSQRRTILYVASLAVTAALTWLALVGAGYGLESPVTVLVLALAAAVAERGSVRLADGTELTVSGLPSIFAAVLSGPLAAAVINGFS